MTHDDFNQLLEARLNKTREVLARKSAEYSTADDKLHNFKMAAQLTRQTSPEALRGMLVKHWCSIMDIVEGIAWNKPVKLEQVDEKIGDAINYLILLEAILTEAEGLKSKLMTAAERIAAQSELLSKRAEKSAVAV